MVAVREDKLLDAIGALNTKVNTIALQIANFTDGKQIPGTKEVKKEEPHAVRAAKEHWDETRKTCVTNMYGKNPLKRDRQLIAVLHILRQQGHPDMVGGPRCMEKKLMELNANEVLRESIVNPIRRKLTTLYNQSIGDFNRCIREDCPPVTESDWEGDKLSTEYLEACLSAIFVHKPWKDHGRKNEDLFRDLEDDMREHVEAYHVNQKSATEESSGFKSPVARMTLGKSGLKSGSTTKGVKKKARTSSLFEDDGEASGKE
eukprot:jgi/Mesen1/3665/ME000202S02748